MAKSRSTKEKKTCISIRISESVAQRFKETVRHEAGFPLFLTQSSFVEQALLEHLERVEKQLQKKAERGHT